MPVQGISRFIFVFSKYNVKWRAKGNFILVGVFVCIIKADPFRVSSLHELSLAQTVGGIEIELCSPCRNLKLHLLVCLLDKIRVGFIINGVALTLSNMLPKMRKKWKHSCSLVKIICLCYAGIFHV